MEYLFRCILILVMEKKDLIKLIDEMLIPIGFKRKGNNWVANGAVLTKIINLQQSNYGNQFYINYGYIIKNLELTTTTHVENRLASTNMDEQKEITNLLNLEIEIPSDKRVLGLSRLIVNKIISPMQLINTEVDLLNHLRNRPHLKDIPLVVKRYFNLE